MDIKAKFLELTSHTYPHGKEHLLFDKINQDLSMDDYGNLYIQIGESDVMFTSHLDTATSAFTDVKHVFDGDIIKTDGKSILGADDKAGVTVMLYMIENEIPGLYYFFLGEEVGCVGSRKVSADHSKEKLDYINKVISFDRRGTDSVITYQGGSRCASNEFAEALSAEFNKHDEDFNYRPDPTGIYTDSAQFVSIYPECTNISVGYYSEHTHSERQDITHLEKLAKACLKVDWTSLPVKRDPSKKEYSNYGYYGWGYDGEDWGVGEYSGHNTTSRYSSSYTPGRIYPATPSLKKVSFFDEEFLKMSSITINSKTNEVISIDISSDRIVMEECLIHNLLNDLEVEFDEIHWDGMKLKVIYNDKETCNVSNREDLKQYIPELDIKRIVLASTAGEQLSNMEEEEDIHIWSDSMRTPKLLGPAQICIDGDVSLKNDNRKLIVSFNKPRNILNMYVETVEGKKVIQVENSGLKSEVDIDVTNLVSGEYFIKIIEKDGEINKYQFDHENPIFRHTIR